MGKKYCDFQRQDFGTEGKNNEMKKEKKVNVG